ncbi:MAG: AAA family ATPase [Bacteroidota bacterium]
MNKLNHLKFNTGILKIAKDYASEIQQHVLDKGRYENVLLEIQDGNFTKASINVAFPAAKDGFSYPAYELNFDFFYKNSEQGVWAIVPVLPVETLVETIDQLEASLRQVILQDFKRHNRWGIVQDIVQAIWYDSVELLRQDINLKFHSPAELGNLEDSRQKKWLPKVAQPLRVTQTETYGRTSELNQLVRALKASHSRNVLLVGAAGVGKTALLRELVFQKKQLGIKGEIWETTASILIKELTQDTGWQDNIAYLVKELKESRDLLFVRNLLDLFEVGKYEGNSISIAEFLLSHISKGEISIVSECTAEEKAIIELRSSNFLPNFQLINLEAPQADLEAIILNKVQDIANTQAIEIVPEAIKETIRLNKRFTPYSGFPGKPIRFLESIILSQTNDESEKVKEITRKEVINQFCEETSMPTFMVDPEIPMYPNRIKDQFNRDVFGQEMAVEGVVNMLNTVKTGLSKVGKPIASFLFVGPTGVGKTELAKVLSEFMFGNRNKMVRFDMSEYSGWDAVSKLLGTGFYADGLLTSTVRRTPFCVLLFDEIEKAHPDFFDLLLQMLSEGRLTDSGGRLVNFCSTIIIMTSNIGAAAMQRRTIGPSAADQSQVMRVRYLKAVQDYFKPELYNRIDQVIPFGALSGDTVKAVVQREIALLKKREGIKYRRMDLSITDDVIQHLAKVGYDVRYGARNLQRTLRAQLVIPLSRALNRYDTDDQLEVKLFLKNQTIKIEVEADPLGIDLLFEEIEKNDYTDLAGEHRRSVQRFQEGYFFTQLMSDWDILKREKEKLGDKFWEKKSRSDKYAHLLNIKTEVEALAVAIQRIESDYSLACMDLMTYKPEWNEAMESWKKDFFGMKIKSLIQSDQGLQRCDFRIYGYHPQPLVKLYLQIFEHKDFEVVPQTIWYRSTYYNEVILKKQPKGKSTYAPRKAYLLKAWEDNFEANFISEEKSDLLCGVTFALTGDCPAIFLENENGVQRMKIDDKETRTFHTETVSINQPIQDKIHSVKFYGNSYPIRILRPLFLEDKNLGIKREVSRGKYLDLILPALEKQFVAKINAAIK